MTSQDNTPAVDDIRRDLLLLADETYDAGIVERLRSVAERAAALVAERATLRERADSLALELEIEHRCREKDNEYLLAERDSARREREQAVDALREITESRESFGDDKLYANHAERVAFNALGKLCVELGESKP